jgi:hypothetical protein
MYPILFPDMAVADNEYGVKPLKGNLIPVLKTEPAPNPSFVKDAINGVFTRLETNKLKDKALLKGPASIKGNFTYTTTRGLPRLKTMSGGVVNTKNAESTIQALLRERKLQLDDLAQTTFESVAPARVKENLPVLDTFGLDETFGNLLSSLDEGVINNTLLKFTSSIMNFFLTKADKIPDHKFGQYMDILNDIIQLIDGKVYHFAELDSTTEKQKQTRIISLVEKDVREIIKFIEVYTGFLGSPTKTKAKQLEAIRNKLLLQIRNNVSGSLETARNVQGQYEEGYIPPRQRFGPGSQDSALYSNAISELTSANTNLSERRNLPGRFAYEGPPGNAAMMEQFAEAGLPQEGQGFMRRK